MSITIEIDAGSIRVVDTTKGADPLIAFKKSVAVTLPVHKTVTVADGQTAQTLQFDSITAGEVLVLVSDGAISVKINGSATAIPVNTLLLIVDTAGGITSLTFANSSGATRTVEVLIAS